MKDPETDPQRPAVEGVKLTVVAYARSPSLEMNVAVAVRGLFPPCEVELSRLSEKAVEYGRQFGVDLNGTAAGDWRPMTREEIRQYDAEDAEERRAAVEDD